MERAFGGADNFLVAAIIFIIVFFEVEGDHDRPPASHLSHRSFVKILAIAMAFIATLIFGVLKSHSLSPSADTVTLVQGAQSSVALLLFASTFAVAVKLWLISIQWTNERNGGGT